MKMGSTVENIILVICLMCFQQVVFCVDGDWGSCSLKCVPGAGWLYPQMVLQGGTFVTIPGIATAPQCQTLCAQIPECEFFTQDEADNSCKLKNTKTGAMKSIEKRNAYSGPKCGGNPLQKVDYCGYIVDGLDYAGADTGSVEVEDVMDCQQECIVSQNQNKNCWFWTFDTATKKCWFKKQFGWTIKPKAGVISGMGCS